MSDEIIAGEIKKAEDYLSGKYGDLSETAKTAVEAFYKNWGNFNTMRQFASILVERHLKERKLV